LSGEQDVDGRHKAGHHFSDSTRLELALEAEPDARPDRMERDMIYVDVRIRGGRG